MTTTTADAEIGRESAETMPRAVAISLAAIGFGILAQLLFFDAALGINFPIAIAVLLAAGWLAPRRAGRPRPADAWLPLAALVFAGFVALRGDGTLVALDVLGSLGLTGAALASFGGLRVVQRPIGSLLVLGARLAGAVVVASARPLEGARRQLSINRTRPGLGRGAPVVRGLLLAIPLLLMFTVLFASADAVFAEWTDDLLHWDLDLGSLPGRVLLATAAAWVAGGLLAFVAVARPGDAESGRLEGAWGRRPRLGTTEATTLLVVLDLLFAAFVVLQATYLFGGADTRAAGGLTYAEYARRGFFELLAVAFLVGGLILALEGFVARRSRTYVLTAIGLVLMTLVVLASAYLRLRLYQDAYGWTELRFYVLAAIGWLAAGAIGAIVLLWADRSSWLLHVVLGLSVVFGLAFNVIGPLRFVAEQNIARAIDPSLVPPDGEAGLDAWYLGSLGTDALVPLAEALPRLPSDARAEAEEVLEIRALLLAEDEPATAWQAWNLSRERARAVLNR